MDGEMKCPFCSLRFKTKSGFRKHKKAIHPEKAESLVVRGRVCGHCQLCLKDLWTLGQHVRDSHEEKADTFSMEFPSEAGFIAWKLDKEKEGGVEYRVSKTSAKEGLRFYVCHRSGKFVSQASGDPKKGRAPRDHVSIRAGFDCTAFFSAVAGDRGVVSVEGCLDHYKHDISPKYLHISCRTQSEVGKMVQDDRSPQYIVDHFTRKGEGREKVIRTQDVRNIKTKLGMKPYQRAENDPDSVAIWFEEHQRIHGDKSPFFAYQPFVNGDMDTFCLGIMTDFQRKMFISQANNVVSIDGTHHTTQYCFILVTVLVIDENGRGFPAAWFITPKEKNENYLDMFFFELRKR